ncbi:hypothetical protein [Maribellus mangrovi]|uniref:hypothetical protein n=1 Tax=Maribellus mangrovi TaxID=3133146 RepID=UPI0030EB6C95
MSNNITTSGIWNVVSWVFGLAVFINGILNMFLGNDFALGVTFVLLSVVYFPPANRYLKKRFGFSFSPFLKILVAALLLWITGAVGAIAEGYVF